MAGRMRSLADAEVCEVYSLEGADLVTRSCVDRDGRARRRVGARRPLATRRAAQRAIESQQPVAVYDAATDDGLSAGGRRHLLASGYPREHPPAADRARRGHRPGRRSSTATPASSRGVALLQGLAQIAAQAMANARLLDEAKNRAAVLRELVELGALIWQTHDVASLARVVAQRLTTTIGAYCCELFRIDGGELRCVASYDTEDGFSEDRLGRAIDRAR